VITFQEDDEDEIQFSRLIIILFGRIEELETTLEASIEPVEGTPLFLDDSRAQHYTVSGYAYGQLSVATGCIAALKQMMVREDEETVHLVASPFGAYALVRNALDAAATALWLLEPVNGTLRIKRRLLLGVDEARKTALFRQTLEQPSLKAARLTRLQEVARLAGLEHWDPLREKLPSMTQMLRALERWHSGRVVLPWLAAWQLASGHAHGKLWAQLASNEMKEIQETRTEIGAQFQMAIRYGMLATLLKEAVQLTTTAGARYLELANGQTQIRP